MKSFSLLSPSESEKLCDIALSLGKLAYWSIESNKIHCLICNNYVCEFIKDEDSDNYYYLKLTLHMRKHLKLIVFI